MYQVMWAFYVFAFVCIISKIPYSEHIIPKKSTAENGTGIKQYSLKITKYLCVGVPYSRSKLHHCKTVLRRNKPAVLNISITVPEVLTYIWLTVKLHYKFQTYQPLLIDLEKEACEYLAKHPFNPIDEYIYNIFAKTLPQVVSPCPHGNRTYTAMWWLQERYTPSSMPAGDYRLDVKFFGWNNITLFYLEVYFSARRKGIIGSMIEW
ncbi:uncharacterized protein LOC128730898 [Anopheles nili]|uniref:uncharacterized protein LOC128730898 n=1 Tax=Anopheles nili TaxID=185578 RepID=UPI00237C0BFC|nr:uncharacterized protein LOC128730898 [Anopheles nili]